MSYNENFIINVHRMLNVLINVHTNCIEQIKKFTFAITFVKNNIERTQKNAFFSKIMKNVLNVSYIYADDHLNRQIGLYPSRGRSRTSRRGHMWIYRTFPAVLKWMSVLRG